MSNRWQAHCPGCGRFLLEEPAGSGGLACRDCGHVIDYLLFPAASRREVAVAAPRAEGESACFNHPHKRAEHECEACGKFLCALCSVQVGAHRICPECLHAGRKAKSSDAKARVSSLGDTFVSQRFVPGPAALLMAALGLLIFVSFITAPIALALAVLALRKPGSLVSRYRAQAIVAIVLAVLQLGFLAFSMLSN